VFEQVESNSEAEAREEEGEDEEKQPEETEKKQEEEEEEKKEEQMEESTEEEGEGEGNVESSSSQPSVTRWDVFLFSIPDHFKTGNYNLRKPNFSPGVDLSCRPLLQFHDPTPFSPLILVLYRYILCKVNLFFELFKINNFTLNCNTG
jgi:hypothetical protein